NRIHCVPSLSHDLRWLTISIFLLLTLLTKPLFFGITLKVLKLTRSTSDRPQRSNRQTRTRSTSRRRAAAMRASRSGRADAPDPTSLISTVTVHLLFLA